MKVGFYDFGNEQDALDAEKEVNNVAYLRKNMETEPLEKVVRLYEKLAQEQMLKTPIGFEYMKELREYLIARGYDEEKIPAIRVPDTYRSVIRMKTNPALQRVKPSKEGEKKNPLVMSILINITLAVIIIFMFIIAVTSNQPNILNYERVLQDQYSAWEMDLTEREAVVREKERELLNGE